MDLCILDESLLKVIDKRTLLKDELSKFINDTIKYLELDEYLSSIIFDKESNNLATYNFFYRDITINYKRLIDESFNVVRKAKLNTNIYLFSNLLVLEALLHEIVHIFQNYILDTNEYSIKSLYELELSKVETMDYDEYLKYHEYFAFERDAIFTSLENILIILKRYFNEENELKKFFLESIKKGITDYYIEDYYPAKILFNKVINLEEPKITGIDTYETLKLGYPIKKERYNLFLENTDEIILNSTFKKMKEKKLK